MQSLNRKEIAIKTLLILISILSITLIKEGIGCINSSVKLVENMGGFEIYPIDSSETMIQGWYYAIISNILLTLCPTIILIVSIISLFILNRVIEISIVAQTVLMLILTLPANNIYIEDIIGLYPLLVMAILIALIIILISVIKEKSLVVFYILGLILFIVKYIDVYKFWYGRARGSVSLINWFEMYGIKYALVLIFGFCMLTLKLQKTKQ